MDRDSTRIDGSHTRRRHYHQSLAALLFEGPKKGGLSRTRLSCEEDTVPRVLYKLPGCPELVIFVNTAIAVAGDPVRMARAFAQAVVAGREAYEAGLGAQAQCAEASSPLTAFLD